MFMLNRINGEMSMKRTQPETPTIKSSWAARRKTTSPITFDLSEQALVKESFIDERRLPLVLQPAFEEVNLTSWAAGNRDYLERNLLKHGGILFRGFQTTSRTDFEDFVNAVCDQLMHYMEGATPRVEVSGKVYTSTHFPHDQTIALHNELCYVTTWPMKIWFYCVKPAEQGGETPIGDVRNVYNRLDPKIRERFIEKKWMLMRNFGDGFGLSWQSSFRIDNKPALEEYFRKADIEFEWKDENRLRTRQVRSAVARHPKTGEMVWFNHVAFWHLSSLDARLREMFLEEFKEEGLPYNTYYGDGSPIEDSIIAELREAYRQESVVFPWQRGDIIMLDNMLVAHGRYPYEGTRSVLAAMGEPFDSKAGQ
jgi:alpha-ketoglutarate-dependent taurine dioxygenase